MTGARKRVVGAGLRKRGLTGRVVVQIRFLGWSSWVECSTEGVSEPFIWLSLD